MTAHSDLPGRRPVASSRAGSSASPRHRRCCSVRHRCPRFDACGRSRRRQRNALTASSFAIRAVLSTFFGTPLALVPARWRPTRHAQSSPPRSPSLSCRSWPRWRPPTPRSQRADLTAGHLVAGVVVTPVISVRCPPRRPGSRRRVYDSGMSRVSGGDMTHVDLSDPHVDQAAVSPHNRAAMSHDCDLRGYTTVHTRIENGRLEPTQPMHEAQQIRLQRLPASTNAA